MATPTTATLAANRAATETTSIPASVHGATLRGSDLPRGSRLHEGRFGRLFRALPPANHDEESLLRLGAAMVAAPEALTRPELEVEDDENEGVDAGYTFVGQLIDHDLTFDPASSLQRANDPDGLETWRTPRFDLDSLYGRGPDEQPYLYRADGVRFLLGRALADSVIDRGARDVPRVPGDEGEPARAIVADARNDENVILSQLHAVLMRFHNRVADVLTEEDGYAPAFADVQREVRWHWQWVVLHDYLPAIVGQSTVDRVLPKHGPPDLSFFRWRVEPFLPVEFTAAVFRFGHSTVRPLYRLNTLLANRQPIVSADPGVRGLAGFGEYPAHWAIDWSLFFELAGDPPRVGLDRLQKSWKPDTSLAHPLGRLDARLPGGTRSLPQRNLLRGARLNLPSGQAVARAMGLPVVPDAKLRVGRATEAAHPKNPPLTSISARFRDNAPLWFYVLAEAQQGFERNRTPLTLGPVGGRIVAEVFAGLLLGDAHSHLSQCPGWTPRREFMNHGVFRMPELITQAMLG